MRNQPQPYKHDDPTHRSYGQSADSSLLAKRRNQRQNFAEGGATYPVEGASGSARWQGAGPEHYAAMRAEMSPSDLKTFQGQVSPAEYNTFMGAGTPTYRSGAEALDLMAAGTNKPSAQTTKDLAAKFGIDLNAKPSAAQTSGPGEDQFVYGPSGQVIHTASPSGYIYGQGGRPIQTSAAPQASPINFASNPAPTTK